MCLLYGAWDLIVFLRFSTNYNIGLADVEKRENTVAPKFIIWIHVCLLYYLNA